MRNFLAISMIIFCLSSSILIAADKVTIKKSTKTKGDFATTPFDPTLEKLPVGYLGHNLIDIIAKLNPPKPKSEFEKTVEYENRVAGWKNTRLLGTILNGDTLAILMHERIINSDALSVKYDADIEELETTIIFQSRYMRVGAYGTSDDYKHIDWLKLFYNSKKTGSYIGQTGMGIKAKVARYVAINYGMGMTDGFGQIRIVKKMTREEALSIKSKLGVFVVAKLDDPYSVNYSSTTTATVDDPEEWHTNYKGLLVKIKSVWLVNMQTGEIVAKSNDYAGDGEVVKKQDISKGASAESIKNGKKLYISKCKSCHGVDGKFNALGKSNPVAGSSTVYDDLKGYKAGVLNKYGLGAVMKGNSTLLSDEDMKAIAAYIMTL